MEIRVRQCRLFQDQLTQLGLVINGAILVLFALGLLRTVGILLSYMREEVALTRFVRNVEKRRTPIR